MKSSRISDLESHPLSEREVARAWDGNADSWAEQVRKGRDIYREVYNNPAFLEFVAGSIGELAGKSVLDAGCGEGYNTRILARRGAKMIGADISQRMIDLARDEEQSEPLGIRYEVNSFSDLSIFAEAGFDAAVSFMALMDGPDFPGAMRAIGRVLRPGGMLVFSLTHPCFVTKGFNWIRDESGVENALAVAHYFNDQPWVERWKFTKTSASPEAEPFAVPRFDRTLSFYLNTLIESGFALSRIGEPRPGEEACRAYPFLRRWREHAPLFFYVSAQKPR